MWIGVATPSDVEEGVRVSKPSRMCRAVGKTASSWLGTAQVYLHIWSCTYISTASTIALTLPQKPPLRPLSIEELFIPSHAFSRRTLIPAMLPTLKRIQTRIRSWSADSQLRLGKNVILLATHSSQKSRIKMCNSRMDRASLRGFRFRLSSSESLEGRSRTFTVQTLPYLDGRK